MERPPIGVMPQSLFWEKIVKARMGEIISAMERCTEAGTKIPPEWFAELRELTGNTKSN